MANGNNALLANLSSFGVFISIISGVLAVGISYGMMLKKANDISSISERVSDMSVKAQQLEVNNSITHSNLSHGILQNKEDIIELKQRQQEFRKSIEQLESSSKLQTYILQSLAKKEGISIPNHFTDD